MKRIKDEKTGKALTKYDMAFRMGYYRNIPWRVMSTTLSYNDMVEWYSKFMGQTRL